MSFYLATGAGQEVEAYMDGDIYAGIIGSKTVIMPVGNQMSYEIVDSNTVRVYDGVVVRNGRCVIIPNGSYEDFEIPAGSSGAKNTYTLAFYFYKNNGKEYVRKAVNEGKTSVTNGSIRNNSSGSIPLYVVEQDGFNISSVKVWGTVGESLVELSEKLAKNTFTDSGKVKITLSDKDSGSIDAEKAPCYRKVNGVVFLSGRVHIDKRKDDSDLKLFTLPKGYRPDAQHMYLCPCSTKKFIAHIYIADSGNAYLRTVIDTSSGNAVIDAISWVDISTSFLAG